MFTVSLLNNEKEEKTYDIKMLDWGGTSLKESQDIISSRPVVTIPPGQVAKIRFQFVERKSAPMSFYQVVLKDITPRKKDEVGARTVVEMHVPVFVAGEGEAKTSVELKDGVLKNTGTTHIQITEIAGARVVAYVLPGESFKVPGVKDIKEIKYNSDVQ
jgi:P pilus assembly chaperone PapD